MYTERVSGKQSEEKTGKAAGSDNTTTEMLKAQDDNAITLIIISTVQSHLHEWKHT